MWQAHSVWKSIENSHFATTCMYQSMKIINPDILIFRQKSSQIEVTAS